MPFSSVTKRLFSPQIRSYDTASGTNIPKGGFEYLEALYNVEFYWYAQDTTFQVFESGKRIRRIDNKSFADDGFSVGDFCEIRWGFGAINLPTVGFKTFTITAISQDGFTIFTDLNDVLLSNIELTPDTEPLITGLTTLDNAKYEFGLIENSESFNTKSKLTGEDQRYTIEGITAVDTVGQVGGSIKGWASKVGGVTMKSLTRGALPVIRAANFGDTGGTVPSDGVQNFEIVHRFPVLPFYKNGELDDLENKQAPTFLAGKKSLKHVFSLEMVTNISDEQQGKTVRLDTTLGSIGYFGENFNGIETQYSFESISYEVGGQANPSLLANGVTDVTVIVNSADSTFTGAQNVVITHSYLPENEEEYLNSENYFEDNFAYEAIEKGASGNIVKNVVTTNLGGNQLQIEFQIDTTNTLPDLTAESNYLLSVVLDNDAETQNNSDRTVLQLDINTYDQDPDIPDLLLVDSFELFNHVTDVGTGGNTDYKGWIQDGYAVTGTFRLDRSKFAFLDSFFVEIVAWNDSKDEYFTLQSNEYNLSDAVIDGDGNQQININLLQGFKLDELDQFNQKILTTGSFDGTFIAYDFQIGLKINWQDWLTLPDADTVFYNASQPNNGLNQNASNYNLKEGYQLRTILRADVLETEQNVITEYIHRSELNALNFDEFSGDDWSGVITTKRDDTGADANGKILGTGNSTQIIATFTPNFVITPDPDDYEGIIRIVEQLPSGDKTIYELSTVRSAPPNNLLIPLDGEPLTKLTVVGSDVVLECRTDKALIQNVNYTLSARLISEGNVIVGDFNDDFGNDFFN